MFKYVKGKNGTTSFLPLDSKKGGNITYVKDAICLTEDQTKYIYKKVEQGRDLNTETMKQEMEEEKVTEIILNGENENPYQKVVLNNEYKEENKTAHIENWSILGDNIRYVQHDESSKTTCNLDMKTLDHQQHKRPYLNMKGEESQTRDVDFGSSPERMRSNYLAMYERVHADVIYTNRFDESSDLSTTYLGTTTVTRETKIKAEEKFPISGQGYTLGKLLDGMECKILLDTGTSKSYMSKSFYLRCKTLHALPKFASNIQRIQVGNGQYVGVLFVIPVIIDVHGHRFEIFTLVLEIHENVDLVLGIKNIFKLEGVIDSHDSCFSFWNRSIPLFPKEKVEIKPKEQKLVIIEAPFVEDISGMAIVKLLDMPEHITVMLKLNFIRNRVTLIVTNKTKWGVLRQNLSKHYHFDVSDKFLNNRINDFRLRQAFVHCCELPQV